MGRKVFFFHPAIKLDVLIRELDCTEHDRENWLLDFHIHTSCALTCEFSNSLKQDLILIYMGAHIPAGPYASFVLSLKDQVRDTIMKISG